MPLTSDQQRESKAKLEVWQELSKALKNLNKFLDLLIKEAEKKANDN